MTDQQVKDLKMPFIANEIEWRISHTNREKTQGFVVPYVDSRAVQDRLDNVLGLHNWQDHFNIVPASGKEPGAHVCELRIKTEDMQEWISKSDGAGSTDIESIKGGLSGAFKRAASMWGLGRYLYEMGGTWVSIKPSGKSFEIVSSELSKLANFYNNKINKLFGNSLLSGAQMAVARPETASQMPQTGIQSGQAQIQQQARPQQNNWQPSNNIQEFYQVQNAKTTTGGSGNQTLVTLRKNTGESISGYIQGDAGLQAGQKLINVSFTAKDHPVTRTKYNIINSYQVAA